MFLFFFVTTPPNESPKFTKDVMILFVKKVKSLYIFGSYILLKTVIIRESSREHTYTHGHRKELLPCVSIYNDYI